MKKIFILVLVFGLFSCRSIKYIPTVSVKDSIVYVNSVKHDSIRQYVRDSIFIHQKGDTVFISKWHYDVKYKELVKNDTINSKFYINKENTVYVNKLNVFQKAMIWIGSILSLLTIVIGVLKFKKIL